MNRHYLDYNATSPLAPSVLSWLASGEVSFSNPSSQHSSGKKARKEINTTRDFLYKHFALTEETHHLFFHSGATEGINTLLGNAAIETKSKLLFVFSPIDHACVKEQKTRFESHGDIVAFLEVTKTGALDLEKSIEKIQKYVATHQIEKILINYQWVHNETGVVWPLQDAVTLKQKLNAFIHVDSAQVIGKIADWKLMSELDAYTFAGHKFGSLKGIGFSFVRKEWPFHPMILGGDQQRGFRSGTENVTGVISLRLALEELTKNFHLDLQRESFSSLEAGLKELLHGKGEIVCESALRNHNTLLFVLHHHHSDIALAIFDQAGLEISSGAACSSGAAKNNSVLEFFGHHEKSKNGLRLSCSWSLTSNEVKELLEKLNKIFAKL